MPNPTNKIIIDDLNKAIKVEACIEVLQCHAGTTGKKIRVNGNPWIDIPEATSIAENAECYQTMIYPSVEIPLSHFKKDENTFELTSGPQTCHNFRWGQWLTNGVTFRIYYSNSKPHFAGFITSPKSNSAISDNPTLSVILLSNMPHKQVDYIGLYEDFNYKGDNVWRQWQYIYHRGNIDKHIGTAIAPQSSIVWDTSWLPDQEKPIKIMARIVGTNNICYMTPAVENITFKRTDG